VAASDPAARRHLRGSHRSATRVVPCSSSTGGTRHVRLYVHGSSSSASAVSGAAFSVIDLFILNALTIVTSSSESHWRVGVPWAAEVPPVMLAGLVVVATAYSEAFVVSSSLVPMISCVIAPR
jgi:hypothetical protein